MNTAGKDLYKVLWLKSENSEVWLDRRTNYTRSLAVMSMVGYILGLGDRHPSNLMLDRHTGKILHIDFGDCFEVAMHREKFPEKIPFRLTRMLTSAMEVSGIEGNFRSTCEKVMTVLRENRDSLIAMLEAFVHDPLISWRLLGGTHNESPGVSGNHTREHASASISFSHMSMQQSPGRPSPMPDDDRGDDGKRREEEESVSISHRNVPVMVPGARMMGRGEAQEEDEDDLNISSSKQQRRPRTGLENEPATEEDEDVPLFAGAGAGRIGGRGPSENGFRMNPRYSNIREEDDENEDDGADLAQRRGVAEEWEGQTRVYAGQSQSGRRPLSGTRPGLHLEIESLAASISANQTRFSSSMAHHSVAHSRLDHRSTRERELVHALGELPVQRVKWCRRLDSNDQWNVLSSCRP